MKHSSSGSIKKGVSRVHFEDELPVNNSNEPVRRTAQPSRLPLSNFETFLHLLKSLLGTGILAMPKAFFYAGWVVGVICSALIAIISTYCVHLLLRSQDEVCRRMKVCGLSYSDTAKRAMLEGPGIFVRMARSFSFITSLFLVIDQIGTCCVYIIFVASNLKEVFDLYTQPMDIRIYMVCILPPLLLLNYIRNLKYLAPFSTLANLIMLVSFGITFYYMFNDLPSISDRKVVGSVKEFPLFIGMVLFSMEAIAMVLPLRNDMRDPKWFGAHCGILNQVMVVLAIAYITTGFFGYMKYGDHTKGSITLNLPNTDGLAQSVRIMLSCSVLLSHALQCYVVIDVIWYENLYYVFHSSRWRLFMEYMLRTGVVVLTFVLAVAIPNLELFISLVGALCVTLLAILFPVIMETSAFWYSKHGVKFYFMIFKNILLSFFGITALIIGVYVSVIEIFAKL